MTDTTPTPRHDGWTPQKQRAFLEHLAINGHVRDACKSVGMSHEAAYGLRHRRAGGAFLLGWDAALLIARVRFADSLLERAVDGQSYTMERDAETGERTHHRHDNRLALAMLGRLDRHAVGKSEEDVAANGDARLVAGDWEAFLDLIDDGHSGAAAALFLSARREPEALLEPCQLRPPEPKEPEPEAPKSPDDWLGFEAIARTEAELRRDLTVWRDSHTGEWRTNYPAPSDPGDDFWDDDEADYGDDDYARPLTAEERDYIDARRRQRIEAEREISERLRREAFGIGATTCPSPFTGEGQPAVATQAG